MDTRPPQSVLPPQGVLQQHALPTPVVVTPATSPVVAPKHFLAAFFLSFFLGVFGADRFYLGYYVQGVFKLLTFGWFGIGAIVDLALIMNGALKTKSGQPLAGYEEYKGLARKTVLWITISGAVLIVAGAVVTFIGVEQALNQFKTTDIGTMPGNNGGSTDVQNLIKQYGL
jgi:TM2 domain-containing membrane protein YozV